MTSELELSKLTDQVKQQILNITKQELKLSKELKEKLLQSIKNSELSVFGKRDFLYSDFRAVSHKSVFTFKYYKRFAVITIFLLLAMLFKTIESQGQIIFHPITRGLIYDLKVSRVEQSQLLELTPVLVRFRLTISVGGNTGPIPTPRSVRICSKVSTAQTTCYTIDAPVLDHQYTGTVTAMTSFAGLNSPIRLVVLGAPDQGEDYGGIILAQGELTAPVAARYDIAITGFEVVTSRSNQTDTQWFTMEGLVNSDPPHPSASADAGNLAGFHWVQPPHCEGDNGDGKHVVNDIRVGSYDLVPEKDSDLRFVFHLDNIGDRHKEEIAAGVANAFSKVGLVILSAYSAQQGSASGQSFATQLDNVMEQMHSAATASCDGKLAADIRVITNITLANRPDLTLEALTHANGTYSETLPSDVDTYADKDGDFACDRRGSHYRVTYTVYRTSWASWATQVEW